MLNKLIKLRIIILSSITPRIYYISKMKRGIYLTTKSISPSKSRVRVSFISPINESSTDFKPHHYFNQTTKIKSYAQPLEKSLCSTLQRSHTELDINNTSLSPERHSRTKI